MALSNFYEDNSFEFEEYQVIDEIYNDLMLSIKSYTEQVIDNAVIPRIETYRIIPFQRASVDSCLYSLNLVLENSTVIQRLELAHLSISERIEKWDNGEISISQKVEALNTVSAFLKLTSLRGIPSEGEGSIIDFELYDENRERLTRNLDYVFSNNKLFLLNNANILTAPKKYVLVNISIDYSTPTKLMGEKLKIYHNDKLTKNEYNEILKMLMISSLGGPTINNLKRAIRAISGFDGADLYDKYVRDKKKQKRWENKYYTDFDFVILFPEEYSSDMDRLQILIDYLNVMKPSYTKFIIILQSLYSDIYNSLMRVNDAYHQDLIYELLQDMYTSEIIDEGLEVIHEIESDVFFGFGSQVSLLNGEDELNTSFTTYAPGMLDEHYDRLIYDDDDDYNKAILDDSYDEYNFIENGIEDYEEDMSYEYNTDIKENSSDEFIVTAEHTEHDNSTENAIDNYETPIVESLNDSAFDEFESERVTDISEIGIDNAKSFNVDGFNNIVDEKFQDTFADTGEDLYNNSIDDIIENELYKENSDDSYEASIADEDYNEYIDLSIDGFEKDITEDSYVRINELNDILSNVTMLDDAELAMNDITEEEYQASLSDLLEDEMQDVNLDSYAGDFDEESSTISTDTTIVKIGGESKLNEDFETDGLDPEVEDFPY